MREAEQAVGQVVGVEVDCAGSAEARVCGGPVGGVGRAGGSIGELGLIDIGRSGGDQVEVGDAISAQTVEGVQTANVADAEDVVVGARAADVVEADALVVAGDTALDQKIVDAVVVAVELVEVHDGVLDRGTGGGTLREDSVAAVAVELRLGNQIVGASEVKVETISSVGVVETAVGDGDVGGVHQVDVVGEAARNIVMGIDLVEREATHQREVDSLACVADLDVLKGHVDEGVGVGVEVDAHALVGVVGSAGSEEVSASGNIAVHDEVGEGDVGDTFGGVVDQVPGVGHLRPQQDGGGALAVDRDVAGNFERGGEVVGGGGEVDGAATCSGNLRDGYRQISPGRQVNHQLRPGL